MITIFCEIRLLKLPSPSEPGAGWCRLVQDLHRGAENRLCSFKPGLSSLVQILHHLTPGSEGDGSFNNLFTKNSYHRQELVFLYIAACESEVPYDQEYALIIALLSTPKKSIFIIY